MKKFALVLVSVLLVLSCVNRKSRLLFEVHEVDYRNKSDITLKGTEVEAEWPLEMRAIAVCDSFLLVKSGDNGIPVPDYTDVNVSTKVVKIIQSYVGIVNKMVWRKE